MAGVAWAKYCIFLSCVSLPVAARVEDAIGARLVWSGRSVSIGPVLVGSLTEYSTCSLPFLLGILKELREVGCLIGIVILTSRRVTRLAIGG